MEEYKFPIYRISAKWTQNDDKYPENGTSFTKLYPLNVTLEDVKKDAKKWWKRYRLQKSRVFNKTLKDKNAKLISLNIEFKEYESWSGVWFSHETRNVHLSDSELLTSFSNFVDRKKNENIKNGHLPSDNNIDNKNPFYCLMGAEDSLKWKGPCRCKHCVKNGVVRIDH